MVQHWYGLSRTILVNCFINIFITKSRWKSGRNFKLHFLLSISQVSGFSSRSCPFTVVQFHRTRGDFLGDFSVCCNKTGFITWVWFTNKFVYAAIRNVGAWLEIRAQYKYIKYSSTITIKCILVNNAVYYNYEFKKYITRRLCSVLPIILVPLHSKLVTSELCSGFYSKLVTSELCSGFYLQNKSPTLT